MMLKKIFQTLHNNSLVDYEYYHLYNNHVLPLEYVVNGYKKNYIVYVLESNFQIAYEFLSSLEGQSITDVFLERLFLSSSEKTLLFSFVFKELFWLRLNNINIEGADYEVFSDFIHKNSLDMNRLFIEESGIQDDFLGHLSQKRGFGNLTFINFDNNEFSDSGIRYLLSFFTKNNIELEYLSLACNNISPLGAQQVLQYFENSQKLRILDISGNQFDENDILHFLNQNTFLKELFIRGAIFSDTTLDKIIALFEGGNTSIYILRFTLQKSQERYKQIFNDLGKKRGITFDMDIMSSPSGPLPWERGEYYSTIYVKDSHGEEYEKIKNLENHYFYNIKRDSIDSEFDIMLSKGDIYFKNGINLFLFDFHHYEKIKYLLETYHFNYIYLENYRITDEDFVYFIQTIASLKAKRYKINLISLEINQSQLDYLIENMPENIFYIEVNLNKIEKKERYIAKMLKNPAFIFENMELYAKIFK